MDISSAYKPLATLGAACTLAVLVSGCGGGGGSSGTKTESSLASSTAVSSSVMATSSSLASSLARSSASVASSSAVVSSSLVASSSAVTSSAATVSSSQASSSAALSSSLAPASSAAASSSAAAVSSSSAVVASSSSVVSSSSVASSSSLAASSSLASSSAAAITTTYKVNVDVPAGLLPQPVVATWPQKLGQWLVPAAMADTATHLNANNFAVVVVDLSGKVLERIPLSDSAISKNTDGTWSVQVPGKPRIDCLIVADVNKPIVLAVAANINQSSLVFAPTTGENLEVGIGSTAAFKTFIDELGGTGTFASLNIDPQDTKQVTLLKELVSNIQGAIEDQDFAGSGTVEDAVATIKATVVEVVKQEVLNIKNPSASTLASAMQAEGGLHWYEEDDDGIMHGALIGSAASQDYIYNGVAFEARQGSSNHRLLLSEGKWLEPEDRIKVKTSNADGSLVLQDNLVSANSFTVTAIQSVSLAGRNIVDMLSANGDLKNFAQSLMNPAAVFAAGANAYRIKTSNLAERYELWFEAGDKTTGQCPWGGTDKASDFGGNCERVSLRKDNNQWVSSVTTLAALKSPDIAPGQAGSVVANIWGGTNFGVQLIDDAAKTARFYGFKQTASGEVPVLAATSTYTELNLPGLSSDATAIKVTLPLAFMALGDFEEPTFIFVQHNGFVRVGNYQAAGEQNNEDSMLLVNGVANSNIETALSSFVSPLLGTWSNDADSFTFGANNSFVHNKFATDDPNCQVGKAEGLFFWNPKTLRLGVRITSDTTAVEPGDSCSIGSGDDGHDDDVYVGLGETAITLKIPSDNIELEFARVIQKQAK